jgi:Zn-dependent oligopeptidase
MEDMQLLMEQLGALSQSLADSQMSNKELQDAAARATALHEQSQIENQFMMKKLEAQDREMTKLRDKVSFAALDATNEQLKAAKAEAAQALEENEALKAQNQILYQNYADIKSVALACGGTYRKASMDRWRADCAVHA